MCFLPSSDVLCCVSEAILLALASPMEWIPVRRGYLESAFDSENEALNYYVVQDTEKGTWTARHYDDTRIAANGLPGAWRESPLDYASEALAKASCDLHKSTQLWALSLDAT